MEIERQTHERNAGETQSAWERVICCCELNFAAAKDESRSPKNGEVRRRCLVFATAEENLLINI